MGMRLRFKALRGDALVAKQADAFQKEIVKLHQELAEASSGVAAVRYGCAGVTACLLIYLGFGFLSDFYVGPEDPAVVQQKLVMEAAEDQRAHDRDLIDDLFKKWSAFYNDSDLRKLHVTCLNKVESFAGDDDTKAMAQGLSVFCNEQENTRIAQQQDLLNEIKARLNPARKAELPAVTVQEGPAVTVQEAVDGPSE